MRLRGPHSPPLPRTRRADPPGAPASGAGLYEKDSRSIKLLVWTIVLIDVASIAVNGEQMFHYGTNQQRDFWSVYIGPPPSPPCDLPTQPLERRSADCPLLDGPPRSPVRPIDAVPCVIGLHPSVPNAQPD